MGERKDSEGARNLTINRLRSSITLVWMEYQKIYRIKYMGIFFLKRVASSPLTGS